MHPARATATRAADAAAPRFRTASQRYVGSCGDIGERLPISEAELEAPFRGNGTYIGGSGREIPPRASVIRGQ
jgi:hypothetical protein